MNIGNVNELNRVGTNSNEFGSEVIIYRNEYDEIIERCKNMYKFVSDLIMSEVKDDDKLSEYYDKISLKQTFKNSTIGVSAHITIDIISIEDSLPPMILNYFGTFFMENFNKKHENEISEKIGRRFNVRLHKNLFTDDISISLVSYNPYLVRQGAIKDNSFDAMKYLKQTRGEESLRYDNFEDSYLNVSNDIALESKLGGKFVISEKEFDDFISKNLAQMIKEAKSVFESVKEKHKEFFTKSPNAWKFVLDKEDDFGEGVSLYEYDMYYVNTPDGFGKERVLSDDYPELYKEFNQIGKELISGSKSMVNKYFKPWISKGLKINHDYQGDWDDGYVGMSFDNIYFTSVGTEAIRDIVKRVAKKAAEKAGIMPAGNLNINKQNIKQFGQASAILLKYGKSRELINRSFKGINLALFKDDEHIQSFMDSIKPVGKFHVAEGWLIFDLMETDTYKLKNSLGKEEWDTMYDAAEMITKKANYVTLKVIRDLYKGRGIEIHPNPIGHLLSRSGTKSRLMFKLGKVKIEDGTFETVDELMDRLRPTIGAESFDSSANIFDMVQLESVLEEVNTEYETFTELGIEAEMISVYEAFGDIEDLNEMLALESININYANSLDGLEAEIDSIISTIDNLEISLESYEEGTEGFKEVADEIVKQGKKLFKAILRYFGIGLTLHEQGLKTADIIKRVSKGTIRELKTLPQEAREKFHFKTRLFSVVQFYMNRYMSNYNKNTPIVGMAETINRTYNKQGRKFTEDNIKEFSDMFETYKRSTIPQEIADKLVILTSMNYDNTVLSFGEILGARGEHAARKCTGDVEMSIKILEKEIENDISYSPNLINYLKSWLETLRDVIKPYKKQLISVSRAAKGLTKDIKKAIVKSKKLAGIESIGFESSLKDLDNSQAIVDEILRRMDQDPILKLAKDKELIEVKVNPNSKRRISINFKEIKEIEKILAPEDIQKYGGSTYQFLLKLSDTFNKTIMWEMDDIEKVARTGESDEALESLTGRAYHIYKGVESLDDLINEMIQMEAGTEDFSEFAETSKQWIKKIVAIILDFINKDRAVYFFQSRNFKDIQRKVAKINEHNMDDYDLHVIQKLAILFTKLNKSKHLFYSTLKKMNMKDGGMIRVELLNLKKSSENVNKLVKDIEEVYDAWKTTYERNPNRTSQKGTLNTVKSTILKMKFEYIDVRQNFLELEKAVDAGSLNGKDEEAVRAFLKVSKSMQTAYLKGATKSIKMLRAMLYEPQGKPSNESIDIDMIWSWHDLETKGLIGVESSNTDSNYIPSPNVNIRLITSRSLIAYEDCEVTIEAVEDYYKDRANYKPTLREGLQIIKNGIIAFFKPLTPSGRAEIRRKKEEEEQALIKKREEEAKKQEQDKETSVMFKKYVKQALPTARKEAEKIIKSLPNWPEFKALIDEITEYGKKHDWKDAVDCISYYVDDYYYDIDDKAIIVVYDQDVLGFDNHYKIEDKIISKLNEIARKIPSPEGYTWAFSGPEDDETVIYMYLKYIGSESGAEGIGFKTIMVSNDQSCTVFESASLNNFDPACEGVIQNIKNGIVAIFRPFTPSGIREFIEKVKKERKEQAKKKKLEKLKADEKAKRDAAANVMFDEYIDQSGSVALKEAEKILKTLPNWPEFKALVKEVNEYAEKEEMSEPDYIDYYADDFGTNDYDFAVVGFNQDMIIYDNHYKIQEKLLEKLNSIAHKIPHPNGYKWVFTEPYDDEACLWMHLEYAGAESGIEGVGFGTVWSTLIAALIGSLSGKHSANSDSSSKSRILKDNPANFTGASQLMNLHRNVINSKDEADFRKNASKLINEVVDCGYDNAMKNDKSIFGALIKSGAKFKKNIALIKEDSNELMYTAFKLDVSSIDVNKLFDLLSIDKKTGSMSTGEVLIDVFNEWNKELNKSSNWDIRFPAGLSEDGNFIKVNAAIKYRSMEGAGESLFTATIGMFAGYYGAKLVSYLYNKFKKPLNRKYLGSSEILDISKEEFESQKDNLLKICLNSRDKITSELKQDSFTEFLLNSKFLKVLPENKFNESDTFVLVGVYEGVNFVFKDDKVFAGDISYDIKDKENFEKELNKASERIMKIVYNAINKECLEFDLYRGVAFIEEDDSKHSWPGFALVTHDVEFDGVGTEGFFSNLRDKWRNGVEKRKAQARKYAEDAARQTSRDSASKIVTLDEIKKLKDQSIKTAKVINKEIKEFLKKNNMEYVEFQTPSNDQFINEIEDGKNGKYSWELWPICNIEDDSFKYDGDYKKFIDALDEIVNKHKNELGFEMDIWDIDGQLMFIAMKGHYYVEPSGTESQIVSAVLDEFGLEGITRIIRNVTKDK